MWWAKPEYVPGITITKSLRKKKCLTFTLKGLKASLGKIRLVNKCNKVAWERTGGFSGFVKGGNGLFKFGQGRLENIAVKRVDKVGPGRKAEWREKPVFTSSLYLPSLELCSLFPCLCLLLTPTSSLISHPPFHERDPICLGKWSISTLRIMPCPPPGLSVFQVEWALIPLAQLVPVGTRVSWSW